MLSIQNPPPDPSSCSTQISKLNTSSTHDQQPACVLHSDLLISCPKFTIRDYAFSNRCKDINTNWPFSEKSLQLCLNHGVKDLLPPIQSLDAGKTPTDQHCSIATSLVSKENEYHLIDQASIPTNHLLSFTSCDARPSLTSVHSSPSNCEGVRRFPSMVVEAKTSLNYSASKPVKKISLVAYKVENVMKPLTKKCREIVKLNNTATDKNKMGNNSSNNLFVSETMASKVCPVCKTFNSSSNTTLNAHIDQCLSGQSISPWTSDPKVANKSWIKPKRMRSMAEIYETAQHCTIEELERRNGINLAAQSSLPAQDMEVGSVERKRKPPVDFEEIENDSAVYVDANGTKLRILSKLNCLSSPVKAGGHPGIRRHVDGDKRSEICLTKKKKKKLQKKHNKLQKHVSDNKECSSPRHHQTSQINGLQEHISDPEEHLEVEEAFAKPQRSHDLVKYIEPKSVCQTDFSNRSVLTKMKDKGDHLHPTWPKKKKLVGLNNVDSPRYSYVNGGFGSKSNKSPGTPSASPRSSEPQDYHGRVLSLRKGVRIPLGSEPCYDRNNPLGEGKQKESRESDFYVKCRNKDDIRNKLNPIASLSIKKNKMKRALTKSSVADNSKSSPNGHDLSSKSRALTKSGVADNSKSFPNGHDLSSKSRVFSSLTKKQASRLSNSQASAPESTFGPKKRLVLKRHHAYCESESEGEEIVRQTVSRTYDNATMDRRAFKVSRDGEEMKVSGKGETLVITGMKSTTKHCQPQFDGISDSYSGNVTAGSDEENESAHKNGMPCEKDVDEKTCNNQLFEAPEGLCKSSDVKCHEVDSHLDVQPDSSGYMKFCDVTSLGTEDARYPVASILNGGEKMFCIDEDGKSIFDQNVHATIELLSNDGSGSYYPEVDLISIPGPPGSFLPSPSSDEFHGNSTPMSSQDQFSENPVELADRDSSDSPSHTSTICNSDVARFDLSFNEKLPLQHGIQDVMRSSVSGATGETIINKISLDPFATFAGGEGHDPVESKVNVLYTETEAPLGLKNDQQPCCCSEKDGTVLSVSVSNHQDTSILSWPTIPSVPESCFSSQGNFDESRRAKSCNLMLNVPSSGHHAGEIHHSTGDPLWLIPNKACTSSGIRFFNTDSESVSPSTSNPVLRLMGKEIMVFNKDNASYSHHTAKEIIVIDDASERSADLATDPMHCTGVMGDHRALMDSVVGSRNLNPMYSYQPQTSHSGSLSLAQTANFEVASMMGVNSLPLKSNWVARDPNLIPRGSLEIYPSVAHDMWSTTNEPGGFS